MLNKLCKGGCGQNSIYKGWCKVKWISGNKFGVACPKVEEKRGKSISIYRLKESKEGNNPMQDPAVCKRNHSLERNIKTSKTLKLLGELGMLPQQLESSELKEKRRKNVARSLEKLWLEGRHPRQLESENKRKKRLGKMSKTLRKLGAMGKLPVQNLTLEQKKEIGKKVAKKLLEGIRNGRIKLSPGWKKVKYKKLVLRSNWEKVVAAFLDKYQFKWKYETLRISYFDTERKVNATTIPDFYIPDRNLIIEVKSNGEYNSQKTKDKSQSILKKGFSFILAGRKEIKMINSNEKEFLNHMESIQ